MIELPTADSIRPSSDLAERLEVEYQTKEQGLGTQTKTLSSMDTSRGGALVGSTPRGDVVPILRNALAIAASTFGKRRASFRDRFRLGFKDNKTEGYLKTCKRDDFGRSLPFERKAMIKKKDSLDRNICLEDTTGKRVPCNPVVPSKARAAKPNLTPPVAPKKIQKKKPLPIAPVPENKPPAAPPPEPVNVSLDPVEATEDPFANRPTKPEERDPNAKLPVLPWKPPPPPLALNKGKGKVVRPKGELSNTKRGDKIEGLADKLSLRNILPQGKRSNVNVATEGSSIDREFDHSGKLCEIKACWTTATEYKPKPKKEEFEGKARFAEIHKGDPVTTVVVVDEKTKKAYFYWHEGLTSKKLPIGSESNGWNFMGEVSF